MLTNTDTRPGARRRLPTFLVAGLLALAACSSGQGDRDATTEGDGGGDLATEPSSSEEVAAGAPTGGEVDLTAATDGRQIVSTAEVDLTAEDADGVVGLIRDLVRDAGGFVAGEDTSRVDGTRTTMVLRVPPEEFTAVLDALAELGELTAQRISTDEVTEQVVDLESRITTAEASVVRLRALLDGSGSVADIAQVEAELLARETTLETLRGQLRTVEAQVALATINVEVESDDAEPVVGDDGRPTFLAGLAAGWGAMVLALSAAAALIGAALPWLVVAALLALPARRLLRTRRPRAT